MVDDPDWRLRGQAAWLHGVSLVRRQYRASASNDHDHCEFCWVKFMAADFPDVEREGYATTDGHRWICATCFRDFEQRFCWLLVPMDE